MKKPGKRIIVNPSALISSTDGLPGWVPANLKSAGFNQGDWISGETPGNLFSSGGYRYDASPGTAINYARVAGEFWQNSACQSVLNWIIRAWPESYPCVKKKGMGGKKIEVDHALTQILLNPNTYDDDTTLWGGTILSFWCDGNAYWRINRNRGGQIAEFEYIPHWAITPYREIGSTNPGPDFYWLGTVNGPVKINPWDIVHFRFSKDPYNDMLGISPWGSAVREVYTDNEACNYTATVLRNRGTPWMIVSPAAKDEGFDDPNQLRDLIEARTTGDNRGRVVVIDVGVKVDHPGPMKDMGIEALRQIPVHRICALAGIAVDSLDLGDSGDHVTFQNQKAADLKSWNTLVSVQRMMGRQLTKQVLWEPKNYAVQPNTFFVGFDYSEVRALDAQKAEEWTRIRDAFDSHLISDDEARAEMGYDPFTPEQRTAVEAQIQAELPAVATPKPVPVPHAGNGTGKHAEEPVLTDIGSTIRKQIAQAWVAKG